MGSAQPTEPTQPQGTQAAGTCLLGQEVDLSSHVLGGAELEAIGVCCCGQDVPAVGHACRPLHLEVGDTQERGCDAAQRGHLSLGITYGSFMPDSSLGKTEGKESSKVPSAWLSPGAEGAGCTLKH